MILAMKDCLMRYSQPTKNTLLKNAQANAESNFFKRVFFLHPKKQFQNFFSNASKKNKKRNTQPTLNDTETQY